MRRLREYPIHRCAVPLPQGGKAKRRRLRRKKRKPTPPRCARQPLPREGARVDTPSFLWKEVSRRGGGWMGKAVFPYHSLHQGGRQRGGGFSAKKGSQPRLAALGSPFQGKGLAWILPPSSGRRCPEGAEVGWEKRYEKERRRSSQVGDIREYPIHR